MKKIGFLKVVALLIGFHFCAVSINNYNNDSIVIESEGEADSESEDSKKEHKIISIHLRYSETQILVKKKDAFLPASNWNAPHIEIASPPPEFL